MAEHRPQYQQGGPMAEQLRPLYGQYQQQKPRTRKVVKAVTAVTAGGTLLLLSGLTLAATVIGLTVATPVLVICSPVLVPAAITVFMLVSGFLTSGGLAVAAISVLSWIYKYVTGKQPPGSDQIDYASYKLGGKGRDIRDRMEQFGQQHLQTSGAQASY